MFLPSACPTAIRYLRVELRHRHPEERQIVFACAIKPGGFFDESFYTIIHVELLCERLPGLGLAFAVSGRFSRPRGAKLPPASARCSPNECLLALSFCARWTMRWGKAISILASRSAAFTATATSLCTNGNRPTSSVVKPSTKTSASSPNCFSTASGGGYFVTFGC